MQGLQAAKSLISAGFTHVSGIRGVRLQLLMCGPQSCPVACCIVEQVHLFIYLVFENKSCSPGDRSICKAAPELREETRARESRNAGKGRAWGKGKGPAPGQQDPCKHLDVRRIRRGLWPCSKPC